MRFLLPSIALLFLGFIGFSSADLRFASTPQTNFAVRNRANSVAFTTKVALYMEPSTFGYAGLAAQKKNNYDNFLRSNIDNEQDNRNFNTEAGKDHLPFRTLEAKATDATGQLPANVALTVEPGKEYVLPLRWNNPHASEMEINIWINQNTIVVPIKKPVCSGEGYQDGVISFIVPTDFNDLGAKVAGFNGCTKAGDCVLQMYAHSVEPRTYAAGTPVIVTGWGSSTLPKAADNSAVQPASRDPGTDLSKQPREVCLPSNDPTSNIASAIPRFARQVSDVYNHAYQNSDYSPYSGQQQESISKTMQAAGILRMVNGNRGELGQSILTAAQKQTLANLRNTANNVVKNLEGLTNKIINQVLKNGAKSTGTVAGQQLNNCFRCVETSSVSANRLQTNTYVPSFQITDQAQLAAARNIIQQTNAKYTSLINGDGVLSIYQTALNQMAPAYAQLQAKYGLSYQPAKEKPTAATLADATSFKKVNAAGQKDGGVYAATQAKKAAASAKNGGAATTKDASEITDEEINGVFSFDFGVDSQNTLMSGIDISLMSGNEIGLLSIPGGELSGNVDDLAEFQNNYKDREDVVNSLPPGQTDANIAQDGTNLDAPKACSSSSSSMSIPMVAGIAGAGGAVFAGLIAGAIFYQNKKQQNQASTNTRVFNDARV